MKIKSEKEKKFGDNNKWNVIMFVHSYNINIVVVTLNRLYLPIMYKGFFFTTKTKKKADEYSDNVNDD